MKQIEHEHQKALIAWAHRTRLPAAVDVEEGATVATYLFAIPNGGQRNKAVAGKMKAEGVKAGVSDLFLPLCRQGFSGFWLELKAPKGKPTDHQKQWLARMQRAGYRAECHDNWVSAGAAIADYLAIKPPLYQKFVEAKPAEAQEIAPCNVS